jgi:hypothetical protein
MGMYTEFHYNVELRKDTPPQVIDVLEFMVGERGVDPPPTPDDPFFQAPRWRYLFTMDSAYFAADTHSTLRWDELFGAWFLNVRSNLKNYDGEIEKFVAWIDPYVDAYAGDFLGFYRYEETEDPTLIRKREPTS